MTGKAIIRLVALIEAISIPKVVLDKAIHLYFGLVRSACLRTLFNTNDSLFLLQPE